MKLRKRIIIPVIAAVFLFALGVTLAKAETDLGSGLNLTKEQINQLGSIIEDFSVNAIEIVFQIDAKYLALEQELKRQDRFDTEEKAEEGAKNVNEIVKSVSSLYGDLLKTRMEYLLKAKDVFTEEQKEMLLADILDFDIDMPDEFSFYIDVDLPALGLELSKDQIRKLLRYRADMDVKDIELELEIDYMLLDLVDEILTEKRDPKKVDEIIMNIVDAGTRLIDNRINHILKAKDVLTLDQKRELFYLMMMGSE